MASPKALSENEAERCAKMRCSTPDWGPEAKNGSHLWCRTSASGDQCYVTDSMCSGRGPRLKCASCKIIVHAECLNILTGKMNVTCRLTFQDAEVGSYRENTEIKHHWISRRSQKGRCRTCSKTFGGKVCSLLNETVAMSCSWCKEVCHSKGSCFDQKKMEKENCTLGEHANLIVPPTWIVKLPCKETENSKQCFAIKPIPSSSSKPLLVFINPKSGGNQGAKLLRTFQWLLNPRQIFDLTEGGPGPGLELYKRVANLRILACGGDGTVGWVLSVLDDLKLSTPPPIAVLPLGTGNDLARALGWGGGYTDEPLSKILTNIEDGETVQLDRWILKVSPNLTADTSIPDDGKKTLPLNVVNNYFSLGVDALIALEFHEAREARPSKFNSRFRNKMFYGQAGGKDLIQRKWKDLSSYVTLECDGHDMTGKLKELKVHSILFLNIPSYGGGTKPWGASGHQFQVPRTDDGMIEVVGLTTYQLPLLQAGGHGSSIAQCRRARLITSCTVPVQVDGEPCRLLPSIIEIELLNTACMIAKTKKHGIFTKKENIEKISLPLKILSLQKYETEHHRKEALEKEASPLGNVSISYNTDLSEIRPQIHRLLQERSKTPQENEENQEKIALSDICQKLVEKEPKVDDKVNNDQILEDKNNKDVTSTEGIMKLALQEVMEKLVEKGITEKTCDSENEERIPEKMSNDKMNENRNNDKNKEHASEKESHEKTVDAEETDETVVQGNNQKTKKETDRKENETNVVGKEKVAGKKTTEEVNVVKASDKEISDEGAENDNSQKTTTDESKEKAVDTESNEKSNGKESKEKTSDKGNEEKPSDKEIKEKSSVKENVTEPKETKWWFLDSCSGDKFFRIDEAQEHLYYVNDICDQELYIAEQKDSIEDVGDDVMKEEPEGDNVSRISTSSSSRQSQGSVDDRELSENATSTTEPIAAANLTTETVGEIAVEASDATPVLKPEIAELKHVETDTKDSTTMNLSETADLKEGGAEIKCTAPLIQPQNAELKQGEAETKDTTPLIQPEISELKEGKAETKDTTPLMQQEITVTKKENVEEKDSTSLMQPLISVVNAVEIGIQELKRDSLKGDIRKNEFEGLKPLEDPVRRLSTLSAAEEIEPDLIHAAKMGNLELVARFHNEGNSLMDRDHEGRTALHHAAFIGNVDVVRYLAAYAPISVLDAQDDIMFHTALHRAATRRDRLICSILVSAGASLDIRDKQGYTAKDLAEIVGDNALAQYLESVSNSIIL